MRGGAMLHTCTMLFQFFHPSHLLLLLPFLFLLVHFLRRTQSRKSPTHLLPPSPPTLPVIGNLHQLSGSLPHRILQELSTKYGPVMLLHFGSVPTVIVSSPTAAEEVLKSRDVAFATRPHTTVTHRLFYGNQDLVFSKYGEQWRQLRRIATVHLLSHTRVLSFSPARQAEVALLVADIRSAAAASRPVNVSDVIIEFTSNFICRVALGRTYSEEKGKGSKVNKLFEEMTALLVAFPLRDHIPWLGWLDRLNGFDYKVKKVALEFDTFIEQVIQEHIKMRNSNERTHNSEDLVDILLSLGDVDSSVSLSQENIKGLIFDMFGAGTDTTFATIEWVMTELMRHPNAMRRVQEEIREVVGAEAKQEIIGEEKLEEMKYLRAVIMEALRLHPIVPLLLPREASVDTQLQGYHIPKGTRVLVNAWALGRDPKLWDKADEFCPERFWNTSDCDFKGKDFRYLPFGAGRRGCAGIGMAEVTLELVLATLLLHFDWELPDGMRAEELDADEGHGIVIHRKSKLVLVAKPRRH
ncbi:cytochrome P450 71A1-like [Zingiber officinale]|uniref:cytochrome P450 71A1-like n=1 Tax=Zingiber officinale TaxID=94328 RepID=UPI001C4A7BF0|nr:cytochrome P450 71A1-like [Zingiber officinale]